MRTGGLRDKILLGAVTIGIVLASAYMTAVSFVIREQHLKESSASLLKASGVIEEGLARRRSDLLEASRELAVQKNLGSTVWYLTQYSQSNLDRATLVNTFQLLAQDAYKTGLAAKASRVVIYNSGGDLIAFAHFQGNGWKIGYVDRISSPLFQILTLKAGEEPNWKNSKKAHALPDMTARYRERPPGTESVNYTIVDNALSMESRFPIIGEAFDTATGKPERRQLGFVDMVEPIGRDFIAQFSRLTGFKINVFTADGHREGMLQTYTVPDWGDKGGSSLRRTVLNEIVTGGEGYYQCLLPLYRGKTLTGSVAVLESMDHVRKYTSEMIRILWLIATAGFLFILPLSWYFATSISRPISILTGIFRKLASGETVPDSELASLEEGRMRSDELGDLTRGFIAMNDAVSQKISQINELNASLEIRINERTAELAAREQESRTVIENSPDTIARYDRDCRRIYVNKAFAELTHGGIASLLGRKPSESPGGPNSKIYEQKIREVFAEGKDAQFELIWPDGNGKEVCSHIRLTPEFDLSGNVSTVLGVGRDITERMEFEKVIWNQANFDALTKLPNRQMFHDRLEQEARISHRSGKSMALLLVDLDRFKEVNDTLGHDKGDMLLIDASRRIASCIRESDTVARLGGDEFTIILPELSELSGIERIAQDILDKLAEPFRLGAEEAHISASIGISLFPNDATDLDVLFKNADQAMYVAKNEGRNRFSYFTPALQEAAKMRLRIANDLRAALASDQFDLYYQPIVDLPGGKIVKAEALLRWIHPERGMVDPSGFISIAEEVRLIVSIGDWVFREAVRQAKIWRDIYAETIQISINKSPLQLCQEGSISWPDYLREQGLTPGHIAVEITEGLLLNPSTEVNRKLLKFRDAGIQLAIDDFGTGYSSLSYLKAFDIDVIKIDRSYVSNIDANANDLVICQAIILMAHKLGLKVIAEGVENAAQRELLNEAGCDYAQGFFYSKPVPPEEFEKLMALPARPEIR